MAKDRKKEAARAMRAGCATPEQASLFGHLGGIAKVPKGFALMSLAKRKQAGKKGRQARWGKKR